MFIYIYLYIMYARMEATHFSGISFSGNRHGSTFLLWIGVAWAFPENGWTGVGLLVVARHFQKERVDRGRRPAAFPSGLIVINGHKKAPGVITWDYCYHTRERRIFRPFTLTFLTAITSSVLMSTVRRWSPS